MKDFDLEAAKRGAAVCTRRGLPVRIICWDMKCKSYGDMDRIVYLTDYNGDEHLSSCCINGAYHGEIKDSLDLMMRDDDYLEKLERGEYESPSRRQEDDPACNEPLPPDREYWRRVYAGQAMQGIFAGRNWRSGEMIPDCIGFARNAVELADALIEELEKTETK